MSVLDEWAKYITATGAPSSPLRIKVRTIKALLKHPGVDDQLALTRQHVIRFLGRGAQWTRVT